MAWIDSRIWCHPKLSVSDKAFRVWIHGIAYSSGFGTGGRLSQREQKLIGSTPKVRDELVAAGLWERDNGVVMIHDWDDHNGSREESAERRREKARERQRRYRDKQRSVTRDVTRDRGGDEDSHVYSLKYECESEVREPSNEASLTRQRDELWDALTDELGEVTTRTERGRRNKALKELRAVGATAADIRERCAAYRSRWPEIDLTANALVGNWSLLSGPVPRGRQSNLDRALAFINPAAPKEIRP